jgi:hypothetical protein
MQFERLGMSHGEAPFELPRYQSLLCWSLGATSDAGVTWLREQVAGIVGIERESGAAVAQ